MASSTAESRPVDSHEVASPPHTSTSLNSSHGADDHLENYSGGVTVYSPSAPRSASLNPRSCVTCRRRKVRCDKHMPCSNCKRARIPCGFPAPGRAPRRPRPKDPNAPTKQPSSERELELMRRLRKLEGIVEDLSGQVEVEAARRQSSDRNSPDTEAGGSQASAGAKGGGSSHGKHGVGTTVRGSSNGASPPAGRLIPNMSSVMALGSPTSEGSRESGRLVINEAGKSRYVSSGFWTKINDELEAIRAEAEGWTDDDVDDSDNESIPDAAEMDRPSADTQAFIFGFRSTDVDLRPLHPLPSQIPFIWSVYQANVDPVIKILHTPTMNKLIRDVLVNMDVLTPATEALMFAIYYAAITSMQDEEVKTNFGAEKPALLSQYRFATEQALAKANFLVSSDIVTCQALLLLLQLVRRHDDTRLAWTLTGLACRIAQSLGLHRDGTNFSNLTPFEVEMRRRLFWAIAILDLRSAEDQGTDLVLVDRFFDTQLPLNINDVDISPDSTELPRPRVGTTDMAFSLIRYEICTLGRSMHAASSASASRCPQKDAGTLAEQEQMLQDVHERVENSYLQDSSGEADPMFWVASNLARVIVAKLTLVIYQPLIFPGPSHDMLSVERRQRLTMAAIEMFECQQRLNADARSKPWRWLFQTYMQWHAVAYLLLECSHRPWTATMERAWTAVNSALHAARDGDLARMTDHTAVWLPLRKLLTKVRRHRAAEITRLKANPRAALQLDLDDESRPVPSPSNFSALPASVKSAVARARWRKLVSAPPRVPLLAPEEDEDDEDEDEDEDDDDDATVDPTGATPIESVEQAVVATPCRGSATTLLDEVMSNPTFQPEQLIAIAFTDPNAMSLPRSSLFDMESGVHVPHADLLPLFPSIARSKPDVIVRSDAQNVSPTSLRANNMDDNPPPYFWSSAVAADSQAYEIEPAAIDSAQLVGLPPDDTDVNMEEGFDWQNWQENLRGFELAGGGGLASGIWGSEI